MNIDFLIERKQVAVLRNRLLEPPRWLQIVSGPRQSGKTTLVGQAVKDIDERRRFFLTAEEHNFSQGSEISDLLEKDIPSGTEDINWIVRNWDRARQAANHSDSGSILVFDEIQKINNWSEIVKGLWDTDRRNNRKVQVVLLGSAPLMDKGKSDSLMGRFEIINSPYWSYPEMYKAFGFDLDEYIFYGGFPGAVPKTRGHERWSEYIDHAIVYPVMNRDIFARIRIDNPTLFKQLLERSFQYSGQIVSYQNLAGRFKSTQNETTIVYYLDLLSRVGLVERLSNFAPSPIARDRKDPKIIVLNTGLMSVRSGYSLEEAKVDRTYWGRLVESAVGAHLLNTSPRRVEVYYWREKDREVDFVLKRGPKLVPIEVKSGYSHKKSNIAGFDQFRKKFNATGSILVGQGGVSIPDFLSKSARYWVEYSEHP